MHCPQHKHRPRTRMPELSSSATLSARVEVAGLAALPVPTAVKGVPTTSCDLITSGLAYLRLETKSAMVGSEIKPSHEFYGPCAQQVESSGWDRLHRLEAAFDIFDNMHPEIKRSADQKRFFAAYTKVCIGQIFKGELDAEYDRILDYFRCTKLYNDVMISTPRRRGKTWSVAGWIACFLWAIGGSAVAVFR